MDSVEVRLSTQEQKSREKIMQKLERIVDTEEVEDLIMKSINEKNSVQTLIREYENRLNDSFDRLYQELEHIYGQADEQDSRLSNAIMNFSQQHDNAYFEMGIMLGVKLYKNFSHKPKVCFKDSIENILQYGYNYRMTEEDKKLLTTLFLERADRIIENVLKEDKEYQDISRKVDQELKELDKLTLDKKEFSIIDRAFCASNERGAEYGRVTYCQGFLDAWNLLIK